ncbi:hypothetical protein AP071_13215 [Rhodobacter capsulatus]|nr:hypothetical protein AP073_14710 [Rhodobacter capsulatus]KQB16124.1 hypothetical protein AP071_13215 [Rhodobacter capsulatus]
MRERVAVALCQPLEDLLAAVGAGLGTDLKLHQSLGCETAHLAQQIRIAALLHMRAEVQPSAGAS